MSELERQRARVAGGGPRPVIGAEEAVRAHAVVQAWIPRKHLPGALLELRGLVAAALADTRAEALGDAAEVADAIRTLGGRILAPVVDPVPPVAEVTCSCPLDDSAHEYEVCEACRLPVPDPSQ